MKLILKQNIIKKWPILVLLSVIFIMQIFIQPISSFASVVEDKKYVENQMTANYNDGKYKGPLERYLAGGEFREKYISNFKKDALGWSRAPFLCKDGNWVQTAPATHTDYTNLGYPYSDSDGFKGHLDYVRHSMTPGTRIDLVRPCTEGSTSFTFHRNDVWFSGTVVKDTRYYRYRGWVYAAVDDPTDSNNQPGTSDGRASGEFSWKLDKANDSASSRVRLTNSARITGDHYATRNSQYRISGAGMNTINSGSPINSYISNPNAIKDQLINFSFSYEYTNDYIDHYTCVDRRSDGCYGWRYSHSTPDWSKVKTATFSDTLRADHKYGEDIVVDTLSYDLLVGRETKIQTMARSQFNEIFSMDSLTTELATQSWKEINEKLSYNSDLNNKLYVLDGERYYYPFDIDDNLLEKYDNTTSYNYSDYAVPLRLDQLRTNGVNFLSGDNFFLTENTGLLFSLPHNEISINVINQTAKDEYERVTGKTYDDTVLTDWTDGSRYYLNIDLNAEQQSDIEYDDNVVIGKLGLSDVTLSILKKIKFNNYLFGHYEDEPIFVEQRSPIITNATYQDKITLTNDQIKQLKNVENERKGKIHSFRATDDYDVKQSVNRVIPLN